MPYPGNRARGVIGSTSACQARGYGFDSRRVHSIPGSVGNLTRSLRQADSSSNLDFYFRRDHNLVELDRLTCCPELIPARGSFFRPATDDLWTIGLKSTQHYRIKIQYPKTKFSSGSSRRTISQRWPSFIASRAKSITGFSLSLAKRLSAARSGIIFLSAFDKMCPKTRRSKAGGKLPGLFICGSASFSKWAMLRTK